MCHIPNKALKVGILRLQGAAAAHLDHSLASRKTGINFIKIAVCFKHTNKRGSSCLEFK
jgi:hypothetical protein